MKEAPREAFASDIWSHTHFGSYSDFKIKIFEPKGEFGWHVHDDYDELFVAIDGEFILKLRNQEILLKKGDSYLVAKGIEHTTAAVEKAMAVVIRSSEKTSS